MAGSGIKNVEMNEETCECEKQFNSGVNKLLEEDEHINLEEKGK